MSPFLLLVLPFCYVYERRLRKGTVVPLNTFISVFVIQINNVDRSPDLIKHQ
jgi:hypothetical protein